MKNTNSSTEQKVEAQNQTKDGKEAVTAGVKQEQQQQNYETYHPQEEEKKDEGKGMFGFILDKLKGMLPPSVNAIIDGVLSILSAIVDGIKEMSSPSKGKGGDQSYDKSTPGVEQPRGKAEEQAKNMTPEIAGQATNIAKESGVNLAVEEGQSKLTPPTISNAQDRGGQVQLR